MISFSVSLANVERKPYDLSRAPCQHVHHFLSRNAPQPHLVTDKDATGSPVDLLIQLDDK
jgi:hypothetical protein